MSDYNVFICYRGEKGGMLAANIYSELCAYSNKKSVRIFFAPRCIDKGNNFRTECFNVAGKVDLMLLILSEGFFDNCSEPDDIVYGELRNALNNSRCSFLPIIMPNFDFSKENLSELFNETEVNRVKHINAVKFTDVYSFNSIDMLLPIIKDKLGITEGSNSLEQEIMLLHEKEKKRVHISDKSKKDFFSESNHKEIARLNGQQNLLLDFDMPIYEKYLEGKSNLNVLDIGCSDGKSLMTRLENRKEIGTIIGLEYNELAVKKAIESYENEKFHFYQFDVESESFEDELTEIMASNNIEKFDWINILAVISHLKSPHSFLKKVRRFCKEDAIIFIRNIDDGFNFVYPDENLDFEHALSLMSLCDTTGYRRSGRELFTILKRTGYKDISIEKFGLNSSKMIITVR